jgi:hypothetical protein
MMDDWNEGFRFFNEGVVILRNWFLFRQGYNQCIMVYEKIICKYSITTNKNILQFIFEMKTS